MTANAFVAILMGSETDLAVMETTFAVLRQLNISFEAHILSAHRTPQTMSAYVEEAEYRGCAVFIAAAGLAAHLAGAVAAHTIRPVIGVPMEAGGLNGLDALLSTVQMPGGVPVACVAIGKAGAQNAAFLAAQILATHNSELTEKLQQLRQQKRHQLQMVDDALQQKLATVIT
jgi:5-(carboxyamino)imidazole ribonucleotide mutase